MIRDQIVKLASEEVRATVRLYLDGKIRDWFSRSDGKGVILIVNAASVDEARTLIARKKVPRLGDGLG